MTKSRLQATIDQAVATFTADLVAIIRQATVEELAGLQPGGAPRRSVKPDPPPVPEPSTAPKPVEEADKGWVSGKPPRTARRAPAARQQAVTKTKKKRAWPTCSSPGCTAKMYGPSGAAKLCYQHHIAGGGKPSPFAAKNKSVGTAKDAQPEPKTRKVIRRRKGEGPTTVATTSQAAAPKPVENPPLSGKDEGLREVEARLAAKKG